MTTPAIKSLTGRMADAHRLIEIHEECTGDEPGRRYNYDALNRSVIILSVAAWEGFVEDLLLYATDRLSQKLSSPSGLPTTVRDAMLAHMYEVKGWKNLNQSSKETLWKLAGRGWRECYTDYAKTKISLLHTPNHNNVKKLCASVIGLSDFACDWGARRWRPQDYIAHLDILLELRHRIAHGTIGEETVGKTRAKDAISRVERIAKWTDKTVLKHLSSLTIRRTRRKQKRRSGA